MDKKEEGVGRGFIICGSLTSTLCSLKDIVWQVGRVMSDWCDVKGNANQATFLLVGTSLLFDKSVRLGRRW